MEYRVLPDPVGNDVHGIVYYLDTPFLLVTPDGKGNVSWQILYLPDQTKKHVAIPHNFLASLNTTLSFQNGVLTEADVAADQTEVLKAVGSAIPSLLSIAFASQAPATAQIHLYKIETSGDTIAFIEANGGTPILVQVPLQ